MKKIIPIVLAYSIAASGLGYAAYKTNSSKYHLPKIDYTYNGDEYYPSKSTINTIIAKSTILPNVEHESKQAQEYFAEIKKNSSHYAKMYRVNNYYSAFSEVNSDSQIAEFQKYFEEIFKNYLNYLVNEATNNKEEDLCNFTNLKIVFTTDSDVVGKYDEQNHVIYLDIPIIQKFAKAYNTNLKDTLQHFSLYYLNNIRLENCYHITKENGISNFACQDIGKSLLIAANAQETSKLMPNDYPEYYKNEKKDEMTFLLLGLLSGKSVEDYNNLIFDANLKEFYESLNCTSKKDIYTLYKIIYAMDAKNGCNNFYEHFDLGNEFSTEALENLVGFEYKIDIMQKFLENMAEYSYENPDFTLEDNIFMLNVAESVLLDDNDMQAEDLPKRVALEDKINVLYDNYSNFLRNYYTNEDYHQAQNKADELLQIYNRGHADLTSEKLDNLLDRFPILKDMRDNFIFLSKISRNVNDMNLRLILTK